MKRFIIIILAATFMFSAGGSNNSSNNNFNKGIAYFLIRDMEPAKGFFKLYFSMNPNPNLENGFRLLTDGQYRDAARQFSEFLEINPRSTAGLIGVALATSTMGISNAEELLKRVIFLEPANSAAYLCLGMEYAKEKNYPLAEQNLKQALSIDNIAEYKILPARLYIEMNKPEAVITLLKEEADRVPENFHYNYLVAQAYYLLNRFRELGHYSQTALDAQPGNNDVRLLMANYYLSINDAHKAHLILKGMKFDDYNEEYMKSYGHALVMLKDKKARDYLYDVFGRKKWDKDTNCFLGLYHLWMGDKGLVQNWIYRALLGGVEISRLKELFPGEYKYPVYKYIPFFDVKQIAWINENTLLVAASKEGGELEKIFIINFPGAQIVRNMSFDGKFQEMFVSGNREKLIMGAAAKENAGIYLYAAALNNSDIQLRPIWNQPLPMSSALAGFDHTGTQVYVTDQKIQELAFESPFAQVAEFGKKTPLYPVYPFSIYKYNFTTGNLARLKDVETLEDSPPIDAVKKYLLIANAFNSNSEVQALIERGLKLDLTSSEMVKTYFSNPLSHFIIYSSDLKNAFQGVVWDPFSSRVFPVDETNFLGKGKYAELTIVDFDPARKEIIVLTRNEKDLILYNYETQSSIRLAKEAFYVHYNRNDRIMYILNERSDKVFFTGSGLQVVSLDPYVNKTVATNKNLVEVMPPGNGPNVYFTTMDGEIIKMDDEYHFDYVGPDMTGCIYATSPSAKRTAAFINGKLWLIE